MHRVYSNRLPGQRRIHIEINPTEIADLLADLGDEGPYDHPATDTLVDLLTAAHALFVEDQDDAHDAARTAAARQTTGQDDTETAPWIADGRHGPTPEEAATALAPAVNPACTNCNGGRQPAVCHPADFEGECPCTTGCGCCKVEPAPAVGQPAEAHDTDEAHPPRVQWVIELRDAEGWYPSGPEHQTLEAAQKRMATLNAKRPTWANGDPAERRVARKTTTWTVEDER
ncbi:hypothetical protein [Streptomyces sp. NPDC004330]|uniref:hypothetical protein n=1 Tax=Streptomyces sp. NPDC004330 TaxID=3364700 RepID=UPI003674D801